jgi:hypothetical protein
MTASHRKGADHRHHRHSTPEKVRDAYIEAGVKVCGEVLRADMTGEREPDRTWPRVLERFEETSECSSAQRGVTFIEDHSSAFEGANA